MPRGGRAGGRSGGSSSGVRAVANALGIARNEMVAFTKVVAESRATYPPVSQTALPLDKSDELQYMAELRQELLTRFQDSSFFLEAREPSCEFRRYTDKYRVIEKEKFFPGWECLPDELCPKRIKRGEPQLKKRKAMDGGDDDVSKKLSKLEENENNTDQETGMQGEAADDSEEESEKDEINNENEQDALSDVDYNEEDNDYVHSYFDNGENYGDVGSDDNLDDDNAF